MDIYGTNNDDEVVNDFLGDHYSKASSIRLRFACAFSQTRNAKRSEVIVLFAVEVPSSQVKFIYGNKLYTHT